MITEAYQTVSTNRDAFVVQSSLRDSAFARSATRWSWCWIGLMSPIPPGRQRWPIACAACAMRRVKHAHLYRGRWVHLGRSRQPCAGAGPLPALSLALLLCGATRRSRCAGAVITRRCVLPGRSATETEITHMLALTGGYPTLLKAVGQWWLTHGHAQPVEQWLPLLSAETTIQKRLAEASGVLTLAEQQALWSIHKGTIGAEEGVLQSAQDRAVIMTLLDKGLCTWAAHHQNGKRERAAAHDQSQERERPAAWTNLRIFSLLFAHYIGEDSA